MADGEETVVDEDIGESNDDDNGDEPEEENPFGLVLFASAPVVDTLDASACQ